MATGAVTEQILLLHIVVVHIWSVFGRRNNLFVVICIIVLLRVRDTKEPYLRSVAHVVLSADLPRNLFAIKIWSTDPFGNRNDDKSDKM